jgi:hypothetical protein
MDQLWVRLARRANVRVSGAAVILWYKFPLGLFR